MGGGEVDFFGEEELDGGFVVGGDGVVEDGFLVTDRVDVGASF